MKIILFIISVLCNDFDSCLYPVPDAKNFASNNEVMDISINNVKIVKYNSHQLNFTVTIKNNSANAIPLFGMREQFNDQIAQSCFSFKTLIGKLHLETHPGGSSYISHDEYISLEPFSTLSFESTIKIKYAERGKTYVLLQSIYNKELQSIFEIDIKENIKEYKSYVINRIKVYHTSYEEGRLKVKELSNTKI